MKCGETTGTTNEALAGERSCPKREACALNVGWLANGPRLSCGRNARGRKAVEAAGEKRLRGEAP